MARRSLSSPGLATPVRQSAVLTLDEVAGYLRISRKTVYRMAKSGQMPAFKAATHWRVRRVDLDDWIERRTLAERRK